MRLIQIFIVLAATVSHHVMVAQDTPGCTATFANNYNPSATINDGSCDYDLAQMLDEGHCIGSLIDEGAFWIDFQGISYQGGVIIHVNPDLGKALICDKENYTENGQSTWQWGCYNESMGSTSCGLYQGFQNTQTINMAACLDSEGAPSMAWDVVKDGYSDWFLPTVDELWAARNCACVDPVNASFWTSVKSSDARRAYYFHDSYENCHAQDWRSDSNPVRLMRMPDIYDGCQPLGNCEDWSYGNSGNQFESAGVSCDYDLFTCSSAGDSVWSSLVAGIYPASPSQLQYGLPMTRELQLNAASSIEHEGSNYGLLSFTMTSVSGLPAGLNLTDLGTINGGEQACLQFEGAALEEGSFTVTIQGDAALEFIDATTTLPLDFEFAIEVIPNVDGIPGCTYSFAGNFNPLATIDDGSCTPAVDAACPGDLDGDGIIGIMDILHMLDLFDIGCE